MTPRKIELVVSGVVQGVGFRYYVYQRARQLGLVGTVRNLPDGRVQVVAEGARGELEILIKELTVGPRFASVQDVELKWSEPSGSYDGFDVQ